jgi:hypothetical protein
MGKRSRPELFRAAGNNRVQPIDVAIASLKFRFQPHLEMGVYEIEGADTARKRCSL